jgi:hypothetical protein
LKKIQYTNASAGAGYTAGCALATANAALAATGGQIANPASPACATTSTVLSSTSSGTLTNQVCLGDNSGSLSATNLGLAVSTVPAVTSCYQQSTAVSTSAAYYTASACTGSNNLFCQVFAFILIFY